MGSLNMIGPYDFNINSIDANVSEISGGNFALGFVDKNSDNFHVSYIGRSDSNIRDKLKKQLSETKNKASKFDTKNISFKYSYASSPKEAFEKACYNYHNFANSKKISNNVHPVKPDNEDWKCPICKEPDL